MKNTSLRFLLLFVLLVVFGFLGFRWLQVSDSKSYPESLPVQIFMENPLQFAGNRYHLDASIDSVLAVDDQVGRVVLVNADEDGSALPVFLPAELPGNVEFQQNYRFKVTVESGGLLYVREMSKN